MSIHLHVSSYCSTSEIMFGVWILCLALCDSDELTAYDKCDSQLLENPCKTERKE